MTPSTLAHHEPEDCPTCARLAASWPEGQTIARCEACGATLTRRAERAWTLADLDLLARWASAFYGSGLKLREPVQHSGGDGHGREDERTSEWHRAAAVHRRFERMRSGAGCTHYAVLWFVVFVRGYGKQLPGTTLMEELGRQFAPRAVREAWASHKQTALRTSLPRVAGQRLWDAAVKAWEVGG